MTPIAVTPGAVMSVPDPQADPLTYPGVAPEPPGVLLIGSALLRFTASDRPLGEWDVHISGDQRRMDAMLTEEGVAPIAGRQPVLAVGSNASTAQLHRKFTTAGIRPIVPITAVTVPGIRVGVSAHVSRPGYLPATPVADPAVTSNLFITWLDDEQLTAMDVTEPNYHRIRLAQQWPVGYPHGPAVDGCWVYVSKHGYLTSRDGTPRPLATQESMITQLLAEVSALTPVAGGTPAEWVRRCQDPEVRDRIRVILRAAGFVRRSDVLQ